MEQQGLPTLLARDTRDPRRMLLLILGTVLILFGGALLVAIGLIVTEVISNPSEVKLLALIFEATEGDSKALYGNIGETQFAIGIDEPLRTLLFLVLAIWVLGALASILKTLVVTGKSLLSEAKPKDEAD